MTFLLSENVGKWPPHWFASVAEPQAKGKGLWRTYGPGINLGLLREYILQLKQCFHAYINFVANWLETQASPLG